MFFSGLEMPSSQLYTWHNLPIFPVTRQMLSPSRKFPSRLYGKCSLVPLNSYSAFSPYQVFSCIEIGIILGFPLLFEAL